MHVVARLGLAASIRRPAAVLVLLAVTLAPAPSAAAPADGALPATDPLKSESCRKALQTLQAREEAPRGPGASGPSAAVIAARREAATACLGAGAATAEGNRRPRPSAPVSVSPITVAPQAPPVVSPPVMSPPPGAPPARPPAPSRPITTTTCDAAGCWANDGTRLQRFGDQLVGPRGVCTVQGALINCP